MVTAVHSWRGTEHVLILRAGILEHVLGWNQRLKCLNVLLVFKNVFSFTNHSSVFSFSGSYTTKLGQPLLVFEG